MSGDQPNLVQFHPLLRKWFADRVGRPTDVQEQAWPKIAAGEHLLISAPTGTGKTLAAFLWAINQLATGEWPTGHTSVLYISPLRALNYDIQRNLLEPLGAIKEIFGKAGEVFPEIQVLTRSGDTPQSERRRARPWDQAAKIVQCSDRDVVFFPHHQDGTQYGAVIHQHIRLPTRQNGREIFHLLRDRVQQVGL